MELPNIRAQTMLTIVVFLLSQQYPFAQVDAQQPNVPFNQPHVKPPETTVPTTDKPVHLKAEEEFLAAHNKVRRLVGEPSFGWDPKIAAYARTWARKRVADCRMIHSYGPYGENIFWGARNHWTPTDVVESWAKEYMYYNSNDYSCQQNKMCGHFTQIVWKDSTRLGCARAECLNGGVFVICSYDPPGNYQGENPFEDHGDQPGAVPQNPPVMPPPSGAAKSFKPPMSRLSKTH